MLRITDASGTKELVLPEQTARIVGIFKDMLESNAIQGEDAVC